MSGKKNRRPGDVGSSARKRQLDRLYQLYGGICQLQYPGCAIAILREEASRDHIIELWRGGTSDYENLQLACKHCNQLKAQRNDPGRGPATPREGLNDAKALVFSTGDFAHHPRLFGDSGMRGPGGGRER